MKLLPAPLLILLFTGIKSISQETKRVTERPRDNSNMVVKYHVLKDYRTVKHGSYTYYNHDKLFISGFYKNGQKDSVWYRYNMEGSVIAKKSYSENKRTGVWEFYNNAGTVEWQYDFSTGSGVNVPKATRNYVYLAPDGRWVEGKADREQVMLYSARDWQYFLSRNLRYPAESIDKGQQGKGVVDVTVDERGDAINYEVSLESDFPLLGEEAMRIVKLFDPEYLPAEKDGKKVKIRVPIIVTFRLGLGQR